MSAYRSNLAIAAAVLCYSIMAGLLSQIGVLAEPMAAHFSVPVTVLVSMFSYLTGGIFVGVFLSLVIFRIVPLKVVIMVCCIIVISAAGLSSIFHSLTVLPFIFTLFGAAGGVGMSAGAITISNSFAPQSRSSMLVGADLFYSSGGFLIVSLSTFFATAGYAWYSGYFAVAGISVIVFCFALFAQFPSNQLSEDNQEIVDEESLCWGLDIFLVGLGMLLYIFGQNVFIIWAPSYLAEAFGTSAEQAGAIVSRYWAAGALGLLISALVLSKVSTNLYLIAVLACASLLTFVLCQTNNQVVFSFSVIFFGLITMGAYAAMISFGVDRQKRPSVSLIPFFFACGAFGSMLAPMLSSYVVEGYGKISAMWLIWLAYFLVFLVIAVLVSIGGLSDKAKSMVS